MKPLELHIYEKHPDADAYRVGGFYSPYCLVATEKRFTGAELAAEYWAQDGKCRHEQWIEAVRGDDDYTESERRGQALMYERLTTLLCFAILPHASDNDYE